MSVPAIVQDALGGEQVAAEVGLDGEDVLYVTPTRTIIYRGDGLLSDEAIEEYTHEADRVEVTSGRRKARIVLHDDIDGEQSFTLPPGRLDDALHPVLAGVLNAAGVTEPGETVKQTFRFSELTVIVTSRRFVKHIGGAVWDADYEEFHYEDVTGLDYEEGSVATQVVLEVGGRRERIKAPSDDAPELRRELEEALLEFYDLASIEAFEAQVDAETDRDEPEGSEEPHDEEDVSFGNDDISPLDAIQDSGDGGSAESTAPGGSGESTAVGGSGESSATADAGSPDLGGPAGNGPELGGDRTTETDAGSTGGAGERAAGESADGPGGGESTERRTDPADGGSASADVDTIETSNDAGQDVSNEELAARLDDLTAAVKRQNELLETHAQTIEQLIEELKQMN